MMKSLTTLAAATAALGLAAAAPTAVQANPIVLAPAAAAWLAGGIVGGALVGGAVANAASTTYEASPGPGVTINGTSCYFTNRLVNPVTQSWVRERVCTTVAP
jgi:hypothetical protein